MKRKTASLDIISIRYIVKEKYELFLKDRRRKKQRKETKNQND